MRSHVLLSFLALLCGCAAQPDREIPLSLGDPPPDDGKLRIIAFGAHPDDAEIKAGGMARKWADAGHHVKLVSMTNGDIGHWKIRGRELAARRFDEVQKAAEILGVRTDVLPVHDGELVPDLAVRRAVVRLIRHWKADVVLAHRPNDYHPDHRYAGINVQDAAYMVTVPFFCPDSPHLTRNPVFLHYSDRFEDPQPFTPDIVVPIDDVVAAKLDALGVMVSQFYEGGANGGESVIPKDEAGARARHQLVRDRFAGRFTAVAESYREHLERALGQEAAASVRHAEAFSVCEYGRQPGEGDLRRIFLLEQR